MFYAGVASRLAPAGPDPAIVVSPCDAIIGAFGNIVVAQLFQIKGAPYSLLDLLGDPALVDAHRNGRFITLRLTSSMYHRFHAPHDCRIERVTFIHGDVWNINPIALKRVERLFCKNERAVLQTRLTTGDVLTLVPVAAILVASIRLHCIDATLNAQTRGPTVFPCGASVRKGEELGWFEHGSTIIVLAPENLRVLRQRSGVRAGKGWSASHAKGRRQVPERHAFTRTKFVEFSTSKRLDRETF